MKKTIHIIILICFSSYSQEYKEVNFSELTKLISEDSTSVVVKLNGEKLNGKYKIIMDDEGRQTSQYILVDLVNGKTEGKTEFYNGESLVSTNEFKNGKRHGLNLIYDIYGEKVVWRINWVNGEKHGIIWFWDSIDSYYVMGNEVSKEEFEEYERTHKEN